jgi:hypothetical protein
MLSQEFDHLEFPPTGIPRVALVCNRCKTLENYSEADLEESWEGDTVPSWVIAESLLCVEGSCQFPVPIFAEWSEATIAQDRCVDLHIWRCHPLT